MSNNPFAKIDRFLDRAHAPGHCKMLVRSLYKSPKKMSKVAYRGGSDTKPLIELGMIEQGEDGVVRLTKKVVGKLTLDKIDLSKGNFRCPIFQGRHKISSQSFATAKDTKSHKRRPLR